MINRRSSLGLGLISFWGMIACIIAIIYIVDSVSANSSAQFVPPADPNAIVNETYSAGELIATSWIYSDRGSIRYLEQSADGSVIADREATRFEVESYQRETVEIPARRQTLTELQQCQSEMTQAISDVRLRECLTLVLDSVITSFDSDVTVFTP